MKKLQLALAALAAAGTLSLATPAPALADGAASTRNIILGAAVIAGLAIEANVAHENAQAGASYDRAREGRRLACDNGRCGIAYNDADAGYRGADPATANSGYRAVNRAGAPHGSADYGGSNYRDFGGEHRDQQPDHNRTNQ